MNQAISVREINDPAELPAYRCVWESLLARTARANFFQTLDWLEVYWKHFGSDRKLRVLIVSAGEEPVGILPLVVARERTKLGGLRFLTYPLDFWGSHYGPIGPDPEAILSAGLAHVRNTRRDWDVLELRWADSTDAESRLSEGCIQRAGLRACRTLLDQTAVIDLQGSWEDYEKARGSKWRNNFRRWERRLEEQGALTYLRYRPRGEAHGETDPRWDLWDACEQIARSSWQGSSEDGTTLSHPSVRPFLRDVHAAATRCGGLDLNLMLLGDRPLAFAYSYYYRGSVFGLRIGQDRTLARHGAGNVLYAKILRDSFERGDHTYDMGPGSLACKRDFYTRIEPVYRYSHFHPTVLRAQAIRLKRWADSREEMAAAGTGG